MKVSLIGAPDLVDYFERMGDSIDSETYATPLSRGDFPDLIVNAGPETPWTKKARHLGIPVFDGGSLSEPLKSKTYMKAVLSAAGLSHTPGSHDPGIRLTQTMWFNGKDALYAELIFDEPHLMPSAVTFHDLGDSRVRSSAVCDLGETERVALQNPIGPMVPKGMGHVTYSLGRHTRLFTEGIGRLRPMLRQADFRGIISLTTNATPTQINVISLTTNVPPTIITSAAGLRESLGSIMLGLSQGLMPKITPLNKVSGALRILGDLDESHLNDSNIRHIWLGDSDSWITAHSTTLRQLRRRLYRTLVALDSPDLSSRFDIGLRVSLGLEALRSWDYMQHPRSLRHTPVVALVPSGSLPHTSTSPSPQESLSLDPVAT